MKQYTVKLGYNDHDYSEHTVVANNFNLLVYFSRVFQLNFMLVTIKNEPNLTYICCYRIQLL
jgi:hypothetical protein